MRKPAPKPPSELTPADLVVLSLLAERPMHGYQLNRELERREVQDWAGVSRPQVYYSLRKLAKDGLIKTAGEEAGGMTGPERHTYRPSAAGRRALSAALARPDWTSQRPPPPFLTWLALSTHATRAVAKLQVARRRVFLVAELAKERLTIEAIRRDHGEMVRVAELMVSLVIRQFEAELGWLDEVNRALRHSPTRPEGRGRPGRS